MILTINTGSSSLKFKYHGQEVIEGNIELNNKAKLTVKNVTKIVNRKILTHEQAATYMLGFLHKEKIKKVGYRVVHGGNITRPKKITKKILTAIHNYSELAPLHNIPTLKIIKHLMKELPQAKHIAFFDTSFHTTIPIYAKHYAIPKKLAKKYEIQKYGFHGLSHEYLAHQVKEKKIISCHLGNGSSITAIKNKKSIDTTMGFSPLDGLLMGTRSGGLDPEIVLYLMHKEKLSTQKMEHILNMKSGLKGLTGTNDLRIIHKKAKKGNSDCKLAIQMLAYSAAKHINSFVGILGGAEAIVFSAGIGEEAYYLRKKIIDFVPDVNLDKKANKTSNKVINTADSKTKVYVIHTDEDEFMAKKLLKLI